MQGKIHSVETAGGVDGPGIRYVLFLYGCPFRCQFCHNPDTWATTFQKEKSAQEVMDDIIKYADFFKFSGGGVTISGGEPLLQKDFLIELLKLLKIHSIHSAIDTCGHTEIDAKTIKIVELADMFIVDVKHTDAQKHIELTGKDIQKTQNFLKYLIKENKRIWIRCVLVDKISTDTQYAKELSQYLKPFEENIERIELLAYHTMGISKWNALGLEYPLKDTPPTSQSTIKRFKNELSQLISTPIY